MPRSSNLVEILIASPSDVVKEREILTQVILDWNSAHSRTAGMTLSPIRWETDAVPASGDRPQELLNKQIVEDADIVIGVFWYRMGTPTGRAPSGTAEEIEIFRNKGKHVLLYFSEAPIPRDHDSDQLAVLKRYRESLTRDTLYWTYSECESLRRLASKHLARVVNEMIQGLGQLKQTAAEAVGLSAQETQLRVDAISVSARITESYCDTIAVLLTNESGETVKVWDIRLFDAHNVILTNVYVLPQDVENTIQPNKSLSVRWKPNPNPAVTLVSINWNSVKAEVQTIPANIVITVGFESLKTFKRCSTTVRVQLDTWNHRLEQLWF